MSELDLSEWLALCLKDYIGPHADEIIDGVREYEGRIVELEAQLRKSALQELSLLGQEIEVTAELEQAEAKINELEVKLAKAVEALAKIATDEHPKGWIAIAAYNELKGQK